MNRKVTLQDVADYCGLSKSMVAYVIREPDTCKAREETKRRVKEAVETLHYTTNLVAKSLSTSRSYSIGILLPALNNFFRELQLALNLELHKQGYLGICLYWEAYQQDSEIQFKELLEQLKQYNVDGLITCQNDSSLAKSGIPVVTYGNDNSATDCVYPDKSAYAKDVIAYLYQKGHRDIGFMGYAPDIRWTAIQREMIAAGLTVREEWFCNATSLMPHGYDCMKQLLQQEKLPTALIIHSDEMAAGAIRAAYESRIRIPRDLSIISYDNLRTAKYQIPALTTFDQHYETAAKYLVELLIARIRDPQLPQQKRSFRLTLVERESVSSLNKNTTNKNTIME